MFRHLSNRAGRLVFSRGITIKQVIPPPVNDSPLVGEAWMPVSLQAAGLEVHSDPRVWTIFKQQHSPNFEAQWLSLNPTVRPKIVQAETQNENDALIIPRHFQGLVEIVFRHSHAGCGFFCPQKYRLLFGSEKILRVEHHDQTVSYQDLDSGQVDNYHHQEEVR